VTGLDFVHGDAESLPFSDGSFDAVINVEASHAYPRLTRFLEEVVRVLRPGGTSSTLISAVTANFAAGRQHWPTPSCTRFRNASSIRRCCVGWR
jgi:ubiquinone/menaquinone biosynthesis C-methylase UbiE